MLGIYERLIASIRAGSRGPGSLARLDGQGLRTWFELVEWRLVLPLGMGILMAVLLLARLNHGLLHAEPELMAAVLMGLVAGSVLIAWRLLRAPGPRQVLFVAAVGAATFALHGVGEGEPRDLADPATEPALWTYLVSGAVAICAMILPGVSGSLLLVLLGMYGPVLAAVAALDLVVLLTFLAGCVLGLGLFPQLLHRALQRHHDVMLAALIGLMAGSVRVLWPWPDGVDSAVLGVPEGDVLAASVAAAVAFAGVIILAALSPGARAGRRSAGVSA